MTHVQSLAEASLKEQVERLLVCPRCRSRFDVVDTALRCQNVACGFVGGLKDDVALLGERADYSFFDDKHDLLATSNEGEGVRCNCYHQQEALLQTALAPGSVVLDVGCGPGLPYQKPPETFVIGLEASYESIKVNTQVDMRVHGSAEALPLPDRSVDAVVSFYAVHHMTGQTVAENRQKVVRAFRELGRVTRPGGEILIFEISPWPPVWQAEKLLWNTARSVLGRKLDMFFYSAGAYEALGRVTLPGARFSMQEFQTSITTMMPLAFSLPWLQVPRAIVPMRYCVYRWRF